PMSGVLFELARMPSSLAATAGGLLGRARSFRVTPKGRTGDRHRRERAPGILWAVVLLYAVAAGWFGVTLVGGTPTHYRVPAAADAAAGWLVLNLLFVGGAVRRMRSLRYGTERRASVRFPVSLHG